MKSIHARTFVAKKDSATKRRTRIDHSAKRTLNKKTNHPDSKHILFTTNQLNKYLIDKISVIRESVI